jgi:hypothetical protein
MLDYPSGNVNLDPAGGGGAFYDRRYSRWLPTPSDAVSADGSHYVFLEPKFPGTAGRTRLHVVDVLSGSDQLYQLGTADDTSAYQIVAYGQDGIWLTYSGYEGPSHGLYLAELATGAIKDMSGGQDLIHPVVGGIGVFWYADGGPNPQVTADGFTIPVRVSRLTIADGKSVAWFTKDGSGVSVLGTNQAGYPIFGTSSQQVSGFDVWIAGAPGETTRITVPSGFYQLFADSHGVWFGGSQGIYLYTTAGDLQKVSDQNAAPAGSCD